MNRLYILLISIIFCIPLYAQPGLPNADLEDWVTHTTPLIYEDPLHWSTSNIFTCSIGCGGGYSVVKTTSAYSGNHAAEIFTLPIGFAAMPFAGFLANGKVVYDDMYMAFDFSKCGTPFSSKPTFISGYYKYNAWEEGDSAYVTVFLFHYNKQLAQRDTIGFSLQKLGPVSNYTYFKTNIQYKGNTMAPDTIVTIIYSTNPEDPMEYAELTIDLLQTGNSSGIPDPGGKPEVNIFPNPAIEALYLQMNSPDTPSIEYVVITDVNGRKVATSEKIHKAVYRQAVDNFAKGCYFIEIQLSDGNVFTKKFIKI